MHRFKPGVLRLVGTIFVYYSPKNRFKTMHFWSFYGPSMIGDQIQFLTTQIHSSGSTRANGIGSDKLILPNILKPHRI